MPKKSTPARPKLTSKNPQEELLACLHAHAPEVFTEGKVDVQKLKGSLGDAVDESDERYGLSWAGKAECFKHIKELTTATLNPARDESVDFDTTGNIFIEGDNLQVLKAIQGTYYGKIKMIYIDPPYNTGHDFVYNDSFAQHKKDYLKKIGAIDEDGYVVNADLFRQNTRDSGHFHSNWLNMMYPRLYLARTLLRQDGVIFVSIDDNEVKNLRAMMDEIFGEENFVAQFVWAAGRKNDSKYVSNSHEYILTYVKNKEFLIENSVIWRERKKGLEEIYDTYEKLKKKYGKELVKIEEGLAAWYSSLKADNPAKNHSHYSKVDEQGIYFPADISWPGGGGPKYEVLHPITKKPCTAPSRGWMFADPKKMEEAIKAKRVHFGVDEKQVPCIKSYLNDREAQVPYSVFYQDGRAATKRLRKLLGGDFFDHPKDEIVISALIEYVSQDEKDGIYLDFFAGSGTTAHAIMQLNAEDGGNRQCISIQLAEKCKPDTEAAKAGYVTVADIAKERIRRAGKKIREEYKEVKGLDTGFRVFKLAESNLKIWDGNVANAEELRKNIEDFLQNVQPWAKEEDLTYELLLKRSGASLRTPVEKKKVGKAAYYRLGDGETLICVGTATQELCDAMIAEKPKKIIVLDRCFKDNDVLLTNFQVHAKDAKIERVEVV